MTGRWLFLGVAALATFMLTGCTSRSSSRAQAEAAFRAGQQQALRQAEAQRNGVTFSGPVHTPLIPWSEGLTLGQAIAAAGWNTKGDPRLIILTRGQDVIALKPDQALAAALEPMQPGDHVDMLP